VAKSVTLLVQSSKPRSHFAVLLQDGAHHKAPMLTTDESYNFT
jgi:hypothetical protein